MKMGTGGLLASQFEFLEAKEKGEAVNRNLYSVHGMPGIWRKIPLAAQKKEGAVMAFGFGGVAPYVRDLKIEEELKLAGFSLPEAKEIPSAVPCVESPVGKPPQHDFTNPELATNSRPAVEHTSSSAEVIDPNEAGLEI